MDDTYGAYGTSPKIPDIIFVIPVIVKDERLLASVVADCYIVSVPFNAPNVFAVFKSPAMTVVTITPMFQDGRPNGNNSTENEDIVPIDCSCLNNNVYKIQPTTIPISKLYFITSKAARIFNSITRKTITTDNIVTERSICAESL